jgi:hypothetical protein
MRWRILAVVVTCLSVVSFLGCASGPAFHPPSEARPDLALIYIYRTQTFGGANQPAVMIDGRQVTNLRPKGYSAHFVHPHKVEISAGSTQFIDEKDSRVVIDAEAGKTYYIQGKLGFGKKLGAPVLALVDEGTGAKEIQRCRLIE